MPGPGGGGGGGFGGGGGGFGGGPGGFGGGPGGFGRGPGGFGGGPGGPGWGGPGWGFGGPGGPWWPFMLGGPAMGPGGLPWFWWPILVLVIPYVIIVAVGIVVIQELDACTSDSTGGDVTTESDCEGYEAMWAVGWLVILSCVFCCCFCSLRDREEGTATEQAPILATEAPPPVQTYAYAQEATAPTGAKAPAYVQSYADKST